MNAPLKTVVRYLLELAGSELPPSSLEAALTWHEADEEEAARAVAAAVAEAELATRRAEQDLARHRRAAARLHSFRALRFAIGGAA